MVPYSHRTSLAEVKPPVFESKSVEMIRPEQRSRQSAEQLVSSSPHPSRLVDRHEAGVPGHANRQSTRETDRAVHRQRGPTRGVRGALVVELHLGGPAEVDRVDPPAGVREPDDEACLERLRSVVHADMSSPFGITAVGKVFRE